MPRLLSLLIVAASLLTTSCRSGRTATSTEMAAHSADTLRAERTIRDSITAEIETFTISVQYDTTGRAVEKSFKRVKVARSASGSAVAEQSTTRDTVIAIAEQRTASSTPTISFNITPYIIIVLTTLTLITLWNTRK
ncbi:MAG: hypothetical protein SO127_05455 [Muribaculaceae bacterium]|nr:hypothetical protein [Muribaculaceae bacterium]